MLKGQEKGPVTVLLGAQWGDEGKGKVVDYLIAKDEVNFPFDDVLILSYRENRMNHIKIFGSLNANCKLIISLL